MFYPTRFLDRLAEGKPEHVQLDYLWRDVESFYAESELCKLPTVTPSIQWLKTTDWYNNGGYQQCRAADYAPIGEQLDMQYHDRLDGTTTHPDHITAVKEKWSKPC